MAAKDVVAKTWELSPQTDGRKYSRPSDGPGFVLPPVAPLLAIPAIVGSTATSTFTGGTFTTLSPKYRLVGATPWSTQADDATSPITYIGLAPGNYEFEVWPDGLQAYASNRVLGTIAASGADTFPHVNALFADGFESEVPYTVGAKVWTPARNITGFTWGGTNFTRWVTPTAVVFGSGVVNLPIGSAGDANSDWTPYEGNVGLCFTWLASDNDMSEQRFFIGQHLSTCWIRYRIRVPVNYSHGSIGGNNNKWLAVWTNTYDTTGDVTFQLRPRDAGGGSKLVVQDGGVAQAEVTAADDFIVYATDRDRWMHIAYRFIPATGPGANNGVIEVWRKWEGEATWTRLYNKTTARFQEGGQGIHQGYLMGAANGLYAERTEFLLDNFEVGSGSLIQ